MTTIQTVGIAGSGSVASGWAARLLYRGKNVVAYDPRPGAEARFRAAIDAARPAMESLFPNHGAHGTLTFTNDVEAMARQADFIHEAVPGKIEVKRSVYHDLDEFSRPEVVIAASSSDYLLSAIQEECMRPERVVIGHALNPVYILPLVELVAGRRTSEAAFSVARKYFISLDMKVLVLKREIEGFILDRMHEALWCEARHLLYRDVTTMQDICSAINYLVGTSWSFLERHAADGSSGAREAVLHSQPYRAFASKSYQCASYHPDLERQPSEGSDPQAIDRDSAETVAKRDAFLVDMVKILEKHDLGVGTVLPPSRK